MLRFLLSAAGVVCLLGIGYMRVADPNPTLLAASIELLMCALSLAATGVCLYGYLNRGRTPQPPLFNVPLPPPATVPSRGRQVLQRVASLLLLIALGLLWGRFSWGEWPASAGALAYAAWRTWGLARTGKLSAAGTPYYFMVLLGGAGIFLFIGAVIGAALKG